MAEYHRFLFQWHSRQFFPLRRRMSRLEKAYLKVCWELPEDYKEVSETGYTGFSYYTYSHRVKGSKLNSSRIAYGSVLHPEPAFQAARPVLKQRGIVVPEFFEQSPHSRFYGLGWDLEESQFKVYFRVVEMSQLPQELAALIESLDLSLYREEGLVSYTYTENLLSERKVYLYPKDEAELPAGVGNEARMFSDLRGLVPQYDLKTPDDWVDKLNAIGRRIVYLYGQIGEGLDTIAYQGADDFTLYFP